MPLLDATFTVANLIGQAAILICVWRILKQRQSRQPHAARFLSAALACQAVDFAYFALLTLPHLFFFNEPLWRLSIDPKGVEDASVAAAISYIRNFREFYGTVYTVAKAGFWGFIAWAVLMRPEETRACGRLNHQNRQTESVV